MTSATAYWRTKGRVDGHTWLLLLILLLGFGLGLHELGTDSLWFDETLTGTAVRAPDLGGVLEYLDRSSGDNSTKNQEACLSAHHNSELT